MFGRLHIAERGRQERVVELTDTATIGRTADNDIVLDSEGVSHCHAMLLAQPGGVALVDLGSTFGTFVDTVQAPPDEPVRLADGARISIGRAALRYTAPRRPALPRPAEGPPAASRPALAHPHLNTRFDRLDPDRPLLVGQRVALLVWVGPQLASDDRQSSRPLELAWPSGGLSAPIALRVRVRATSPRWVVVAEEPTLLAAPWGTAQVARYQVLARRPERAKIAVAVENSESGTLLQHFRLGMAAVLPDSAPAARCQGCGAKIRAGARFCWQCGKRI